LINEEDKVLILLSLLPQSCGHIIATILCGEEALILEEVTSTLLSNEIKKMSNQEEQEGSGLVVTGRKGRGEEKKVRAHQRHVTSVTGKVIRRMIISIGKSN